MHAILCLCKTKRRGRAWRHASMYLNVWNYRLCINCYTRIHAFLCLFSAITFRMMYQSNPNKCIRMHVCVLSLAGQPLHKRGSRKGLVLCLLCPRSLECGPIRSLHVTFDLMGLSPACVLTNQMLDLHIH